MQPTDDGLMSATGSGEIVAIEFVEQAGLTRERETVSFGVPFPPGRVRSARELEVAEQGRTVPVAMTPLAQWEDGSLKWMLLELQISVPTKGCRRLEIRSNNPAGGADLESVPGARPEERLSPNRLEQAPLDAPGSEEVEKRHKAGLTLQKTPDGLRIRCGDTEFQVDTQWFLPFRRIAGGNGAQILETSRMVLTDQEERTWHPQVQSWRVEYHSALRLELAFEGKFASGEAIHPLRFKSGLHFYAGKSTARIDFTLWNPQAARHPGGVWDLGDGGSVLFRDLNLDLMGSTSPEPVYHYSLEPGGEVYSSPGDFLIYQDSSGGENWRSHNHVNRHNHIPLTFRGYRVHRQQQLLHEGLRATPTVILPTSEGFLAASVRHFWQNFPKAMAVDDGQLRLSLFPRHFRDLFELQGGEQKTHTLYLHAGSGAPQTGCLDWVHEPLTARLPAQWYLTSTACPRPVPLERTSSTDRFQDYQRLIDAAVHGPRSFAARREIVDEYGWRNFGDLYADHEAAFHKDDQEFVSHYNNQYDVVKAALVQFMRTGEPDWHRLAAELAGHVLDIDIYHTDADRYQYNHGMFWHTDHYLDAATSTHRSSSQWHRTMKDPRFVGGGPSYEHNYATGLLYTYWMTGDRRFKEGVLALADYVVRGLEGPDSVVETGVLAVKEATRWLRTAFNGAAPHALAPYEFEGPGRATGNALNTLLDGYLASADQRYLTWAESLISRCVSPVDDIAARDLLNAEYRWMYNIFLQALGRYLDIKRETGKLNRHFWYGRAVLLKYALWMADNEYPYLEKPEILEFPNETWAAQDIRKADVLAHAALYAPRPLRRKLLERSRFFFQVSMDQLIEADTRDLTRPVVILMANGMVHMDAFTGAVMDQSIADRDLDYGVEPESIQLGKQGLPENRDRLRKVLASTSLKNELHLLKLRLQQ